MPPKVRIFPRLPLLAAFCVLASLVASCVKPKTFPIEPYIEFRQNILSYMPIVAGDSIPSLEVEFYFQDGDGDIGRYDESEAFPYVGDSLYNLHFQLYRVLSDSLLEKVYLPDTTGEWHPIAYHYHLHYMEPVNANHSLCGLIRWKVDDFSITAKMLENNTVCYGIYLYDRALHRSNVIYTDPIRL